VITHKSWRLSEGNSILTLAYVFVPLDFKPLLGIVIIVGIISIIVLLSWIAFKCINYIFTRPNYGKKLAGIFMILFGLVWLGWSLYSALGYNLMVAANSSAHDKIVGALHYSLHSLAYCILCFGVAVKCFRKEVE